MKKFIFSMLAVSTLALASCEQVEESVNLAQLPKDSQLTVKFAEPQAKTRTQGDIPTSPSGTKDLNYENTINRLTVAVFFSSGEANVIKEFSKTDLASGKVTVNCSADENNAQTVIVVANHESGFFAGVVKKSDFIAQTKTLSLAYTCTPSPAGSSTVAGNYQALNNLPMSDVSTAYIKASNDATSPATLNVSLQRLVARISINKVYTDFDPQGAYANASFKLTDVFLYNAVDKSPVGVDASDKPVDIPVSGTYSLAYGLDAPTGASTTSYLTHTVNAQNGGEMVGGSSSAFATPYYFYTFANSKAVSGQYTKLVLKGELTVDKTASTPTYTTEYYPIAINKAQLNTTITGGTSGKVGDGNIYRNSQYAVQVIIKGQGANTPSVDLQPGVLNVNIEVKDWEPILSQTVTFE
ncbi:MAG: hypothetical protein LBN24_07965 [Mediterranea sp.]|nr:hypothetical protein [Mediterranea sp.]